MFSRANTWLPRLSASFVAVAAMAPRLVLADGAKGCPASQGTCWGADVSVDMGPVEVTREEANEPAPLLPPPKPPPGPVLVKRIEPNVERNGLPTSGAGYACRPDTADTSPFRFTVDGAPSTGSADSQRCTDVALKQADIQIRYDGLNNEPRLNVVGAPDAALKGQAVTFRTYTNYGLSLQRGEIRIFEKGQSVRQTPIAVLTVKDDEATWDVPAGNPVASLGGSIKDERAQRLALGDVGDEVKFVYRVYDANGRFDETKPKILDIAAIRGGKTVANELMAVYDGNALEVRNIPRASGAILVSGTGLEPGSKVRVMGRPVPVDAKGDFAVRQLVTSGPHQVEVAVTDGSGRTTTYSRSAVIPDHDFFYVALADLTVGHNAPTGPIELLNPTTSDQYQDKYYVNGRLAFYLKGKVSGDTLVTLAADTRDQPIDKIFSNFDSKDPRYLLRNLDPNKYYPVYGDDSTLVEDAPTRGKFYVRLERGDSNVVWGNFKTSITGTEFVRYERGLYGARAQVKSDEQTQYGERRGQVEAFAAEPGTLGARDVLRGTGGALYYMSRQNITQGSERVTVEVRDQNTGLVIKTQSLTPTQDYTIDYLQGRVVLSSPLSSTGQNDLIVQTGSLSGAEQYLVVNYEYNPTLTANSDKVVGGRASYWVSDHVEVGVTGYDQTGGEKQTIGGVDTTFRYKPGTYLKLEGARSSGTGSGEQYSIDGGYTFSQRSTNGAGAYAQRVEAAANLADVIKGADGRVAAYWKQKDNGYSGPGELAIMGPSRDAGIKGDVKLDEHWGSKTKVDEHQDEYRKYTSGEQNLSYLFNNNWKATLGARIDNNNVLAQSASPVLNQNGTRTDLALRVDYDSQHDWGVYAFGQVTAEKSGQRDDNNRVGIGSEFRVDPKTKIALEVSDGSGGLGGKAGLEYKVDEKRSSYLNYGYDPDRTDIIARGGAGILTAGAKERFTDNLSVFGEERTRYGGGYSGLTHAFGLEYIPAEHWKTGLAFETGKITDPIQGDLERTAVSPTIGYTREGLTYTGRFEYRHDHQVTAETGSLLAQASTRETWLTNNALSNKINPDWRYIARLNGSYSTASQGSFYDGRYLEAVTGFAYRPVANDKLNALFKCTFFYDLPSPGQTLNGYQASQYAQQSYVLAIDTAYDVNPLVTLGAKYALRVGQLRDTTIPNSAWFDATAQLAIARLDLHVVSQWDVSGELRALDASTAKNMEVGALVAVYRELGDNFRLGVGYNFTRYTDDLTNLGNHNQGIFLNAVGKF